MMEQRGRARCRTADLVQWTAYSQPAAIQHMRIHHSGVHIRVPTEFLHRPDVIALWSQMRSTTVSADMAPDAFVKPPRARLDSQPFADHSRARDAAG